MKKLIVIGMVLGMVLLTACSNGNSSNKEGIQKITGTELHERQMKEDSLLIIDVRTAIEYGQGHIENAINIPVDEISDATMASYDKTKDVIVYCRSGIRSSQAAQKLKELKFKKIYDLGGIDDNWEYSLIKDSESK